MPKNPESPKSSPPEAVVEKTSDNKDIVTEAESASDKALRECIAEQDKKIISSIKEIQDKLKHSEKVDYSEYLEKANLVIEEAEEFINEKEKELEGSPEITLGDLTFHLNNLKMLRYRMEVSLQSKVSEEEETEEEQKILEKIKNGEDKGIEASKLEEVGGANDTERGNLETQIDQKTADDYLRRASRLLACKNILERGEEPSDGDKDFLKREFPEQKNISVELLEREYENSTRTASMAMVINGLRLGNEGYKKIAQDVNNPAKSGDTYKNYKDNSEGTYYTVLTLRNIIEMNIWKDLPAEQSNAFNKYTRELGAEIDGDKATPPLVKKENKDVVDAEEPIENRMREEYKKTFALFDLLNKESLNEEDTRACINAIDSLEKGEKDPARKFAEHLLDEMEAEKLKLENAEGVGSIEQAIEGLKASLEELNKSGSDEGDKEHSGKEKELGVEASVEEELKKIEGSEKEVEDSLKDKFFKSLDEKQLESFGNPGINAYFLILFQQDKTIFDDKEVERKFLGKIISRPGETLNTKDIGDIKKFIKEKIGVLQITSRDVKDFMKKKRGEAEDAGKVGEKAKGEIKFGEGVWRDYPKTTEFYKVALEFMDGDEDTISEIKEIENVLAEGDRGEVMEDIKDIVENMEEYMKSVGDSVSEDEKNLVEKAKNIVGEAIEELRRGEDEEEKGEDGKEELVVKYPELRKIEGGRKEKDEFLKEIVLGLLDGKRRTTINNQLTNAGYYFMEFQGNESIFSKGWIKEPEFIKKITGGKWKETDVEDLEDIRTLIEEKIDILQFSGDDIEDFMSKKAKEFSPKSIKDKKGVAQGSFTPIQQNERDQQAESLDVLKGEDIEEGKVYKIFAGGIKYRIWNAGGKIYLETENKPSRDILDNDFQIKMKKESTGLPLAGTARITKRKLKENEAPAVPMREIVPLGKIEKIEVEKRAEAK